MFGFSLPELVVVVLIGIVVVGPRELPELLRTAGKWVGKLQRLAFDMRNQSGIDKILQDEGLLDDIQQLRKLLRRRNIMDALALDEDLDLSDLTTLRPQRTKAPKSSPSSSSAEQGDDLAKLTSEGPSDAQREYPEDGADAYGASSQPSEQDDPYADSEHGLDSSDENANDNNASHTSDATGHEQHASDSERESAPREGEERKRRK